LLCILLLGAGVWYLFTIPPLIQTDVLVYGSSLGGTTAAIAASENGTRVLLVAEGSSVGGQAVDAGVGAFDETGKAWESYSFYARLQTFLRKKYGTGSTVFAGPGRSVVGTVSTLPRDIEDFFMEEIGKQPTLTLLQNFEIISLSGSGKHYTEALLQEKSGRRKKIRVRFSALLDGTETGKVFARTGMETRTGFDAQEETGEPSALPAAVRDILEHGDPSDTAHYEGIGNRVQSVGVPFALVDRGYRGDFYPADGDSCWKQTDSGAMISDASVWVAKREGCSATVTVRPEFADMYDVYFLNAGDASVDVQVSLPGIERPLQWTRSVPTKDKYVLIGTWHLDGKTETTFTFTAPHEGYRMEGLILAHTNIPIDPQPFTLSPGGSGTMLASPTAGTADVYLSAPESGSASGVALNIRDRRWPAEAVGSGVFVARNVSLEQGAESVIMHTLSSSSGEPWRAVVQMRELLPSSVYLLPPDSHAGGDAPVVYPLSGQGAGKRVWDFSVDADGLCLFSIAWPSSGWGDLQIQDRRTGVNILATSFHNPSRGRDPFTPLLVTALEAGVPYRVMVSSSYPEAMVIAGIQLIPLQESSLLYRVGKGDLKLRPPVAGMYDAWVTSSTDGASVRVQGGDLDMSVTLEQKNILTWGGRVYLDTVRGFTVHADEESAVLLVPNTFADVYRHPIGPDTLSGDLLLNLVPGRYHVQVQGTFPSGEPPLLYYSFRGSKTSGALHFVDRGGTYVGQDVLVADGSPVAVRTSPPPEQGASLVLYEDIPSPEPSTFRFENPLLDPIHPLQRLYQHITFFNYRNLLTPSSLLTYYPETFLSHIGTNTLGLSLVLNSSSDFAPVYPRDLDQESLWKDAKDRAYRYYYWIKYDADLRATQPPMSVGCNPDTPLVCDPRRLYLAASALGTEDGFAREVYTREGRRLQTVAPLTENQLTLRYEQCKGECDLQRCSITVDGGRACLLTAQQPYILTGALAAASYPMDFHSFYSRQEWNASRNMRVLVDLVEDHARVLSGEPSLLHLYRRSAPTEITLGSLLPLRGENIYPASLDFGVTQIANSSFRTHVNEMRVGASVGYLVAYALGRGFDPQDFAINPSLLHDFQRDLIRRDMRLYPINDATSDVQIVRAVQTLILEGWLMPIVRLDAEGGADYLVQRTESVTESDRPLLERLALTFTEKTTNRELLKLFLPDDVKVRDDLTLLTLGRKLQLLNDVPKPLPTTLLDQPILKGTLYRAVYLREFPHG
jgi:hypothetical protein